jgi:hypothetical protein
MEMYWRDMRIDLCGGEVLMTEHVPDAHNVCASLQEMGGEGMA